MEEKILISGCLLEGRVKANIEKCSLHAGYSFNLLVLRLLLVSKVASTLQAWAASLSNQGSSASSG